MMPPASGRGRPMPGPRVSSHDCHSISLNFLLRLCVSGLYGHRSRCSRRRQQFVPLLRSKPMNVTRRQAMIAGLGTGLLGSGVSKLRAEWGGPILGAIEGGEEFWLATDAYIYGYPLVTMEMTRRVITN